MGKLNTILRKEFLYLTAALVMLVLLIPLLPTQILIQVQEVEIMGGNIVYERDVTFPVKGVWHHEFERISEPRKFPIECTAFGNVWMEKRETPAVAPHNCDFSGPIGSRWSFTTCVQAQVIFGMLLRPSCKTVKFFPDAASAIKSRKTITEEVIELRKTVIKLRKDLERLKGTQYAPN